MGRGGFFQPGRRTRDGELRVLRMPADPILKRWDEKERAQEQQEHDQQGVETTKYEKEEG
jgi:hypothetical protein